MYRKFRKKIKKVFKVIKRMFLKQPKLKFAYGWYYKHSKVKDNQVLFESFHGKGISDSPFYILNELLKKDSSKYTIYFSTIDKKKDSNFIKTLNLNIKLVDVNSFKYTKILATSKCLINNSSFPVYYIRKDEQIYLQSWHGTPLKTLGKQMQFGIESMYNVQHNFIQANYIMFPNEFTKEVIMRDYNLETLYTGKVIMNGYPRNSIFLDNEKGKSVCKKLNNEQFTTFAYMPTWRGQSNHDIQTSSYKKEVNNILKYLDKHLKNNQKLYVNFHPLVQNIISLDGFNHILPFPSNIDKYEFLNSVDALITDYSSVFFDFSVTKKPIILFMYDYDEYMHDRGMYFDIRELPFRKVYNLEDLSKCIVNETFRNDHYENDYDYIKKFIQYDSIDAGKKIVEYIFNDKNLDLNIIDYSKNRDVYHKVIYPSSTKTTIAIDTISKIVKNDTDIVVFKKNNFSPAISSYLYNNYKNSYDFMFATQTLPRTLLEDLLKRFNKSTQEKLHNREIKRLFGDLNINPNFQIDYYNGEDGETLSIKNKRIVDSEIKIENNKIKIKILGNKNYFLNKLVIVSKNKILWTRLLTDEEKKRNIIEEDFLKILNKRILKENQRCIIAVECLDNEEKLLFYITNSKKFEIAKKDSCKLNMSSYYYDTIYHSNQAYQNNVLHEEIAILPYVSKNGYLSFTTSDSIKKMDRYLKGQVLSFKSNNTNICLKLKFPKSDYQISDVIFSYRSSIETITYSMNFNVTSKGKNWIVYANIDISDLILQELYWDVYIVCEDKGKKFLISAYYNSINKIKLYFFNYDCLTKDGHIIFPYKTKGGKIAYTYRLRSKYDSYKFKLKEILAFVTYAVFLPYWKHKRVWLVFEKFCSMAQDNGYYFFKYCMEGLSNEENKHVYFILDEDSPDWDKLKPYQNHVVKFMSFKHILYCMVAKVYVGSDSKKHLYVWRPKPNLISQRISKHKILFLQHGVTALKRVDGIFGKGGTSPMTYFTTTSEFEQKIVVDNFGYIPDRAPILGFTRWDVLEDTSDPNDKFILVMPTWRSWLEEKSPDEFKKSDYYTNYMNFLQNDKLKQILNDNNVRLVFYIHPKFKDYLSEFNIDEDNIELIPFGTAPLNEIMKKCSMLITDYSSVCWDVYYLGKPVLFYQFDYETYMQAHGSYLNMEEDLFGERYMECDQLIAGIEEYIANDFKEKEKYSNMRKYYFAYQDNNNSKRTYDYLVSKNY
ncbi:MAG: CDP-glycerol glycerophosphotransferase family protein [Erysipelotrichaceae bacterium]|nr:CDP-glycerol glycerophosphotransferase family protein [Erysipelotrichaceae bacterium]